MRGTSPLHYRLARHHWIGVAGEPSADESPVAPLNRPAGFKLTPFHRAFAIRRRIVGLLLKGDRTNVSGQRGEPGRYRPQTHI